MQPQIRLPPDQYCFAGAQDYNVAQREYVQTTFNTDPPQSLQYGTHPGCYSFNNAVQQAVWEHPQGFTQPSVVNAGLPTIHQYAPAPIYPILDYGGYHDVHQEYPVWGQYQYIPQFNPQVENQDWEISLRDFPQVAAHSIQNGAGPFNEV